MTEKDPDQDQRLFDKAYQVWTDIIVKRIQAARALGEDKVSFPISCHLRQTNKILDAQFVPKPSAPEPTPRGPDRVFIGYQAGSAPGDMSNIVISLGGAMMDRIYSCIAEELRDSQFVVQTEKVDWNTMDRYCIMHIDVHRGPTRPTVSDLSSRLSAGLYPDLSDQDGVLTL